MGPQSGSCGYTWYLSAAILASMMLQWVHSLVAVVIVTDGLLQGEDVVASMGPQSGSCGYGVAGTGRDAAGVASMGPQSGSCGYRPRWPGWAS